MSNLNVQELQASVDSLEQTSKMLIKRDVALRQAYEHLKSLDLEKTEFVSIAAHQLRTPVTSARWALTYLQENQANLTDKQKLLLSRAQESMDRVFNLVEELLELNRVEFGNVQLRKIPGSIEKLCEEIIQEHECISTSKKVTIHRNYAQHPRPTAFDADRLKQVVDNIIDNAIKYSDQNATITLTTSYSEKFARIDIADTGIGISTQDAIRVFNKFTRLVDAEQIDPNGTGLGLYVSQKLIEAHNGAITLSQNKPKGSVFSIKLPC